MVSVWVARRPLARPRAADRARRGHRRARQGCAARNGFDAAANLAILVKRHPHTGGEGDLMSKAFVRESEDEADLPDEPAAVPAGFKNYMTPQGHRYLQEELHQLLRVERPKVVETVAWAAGNGDRSENGDYIYGKRRLREIDRRIRFLSRRLEGAEVVDPQQQKRRDQVFFGATVTYAGEDGSETTVTIVGIDEADFARGQVSWVSPVARALMKAREGDIVELRAPAGVEQLEVLSIRY
jgi:transcription elongation factor GreB